jgi:hypothetical protein
MGQQTVDPRTRIFSVKQLLSWFGYKVTVPTEAHTEHEDGQKSLQLWSLGQPPCAQIAQKVYRALLAVQVSDLT